MPTYQTIIVDITPGAKEKPVLNASQFDNGRPFNVALTWGGVAFTDAGDFDIEIHVKKPDGNIVTAEPDSVVNEVCAFLTTEQMCACHGINECELVLFDNDIQIGTGNFILDVEKAPDEGGLQSASEIANLETQIARIVPEVIGDDYYNKSQTDALLANKADKSDTYTKAQVDSALSAKANTADLATVATSGDYDDLINKPTIPAAQIQSDYTQADTTAVDYIKNKPNINAMIAAAIMAIMPVEIQTGNPCSFDTDIATELQGLTVDIVSTGGGGTPSTPIPIVGHSELNLVRCGKNLGNIKPEGRTNNGVTYTVVNNTEIAMEGTATATSWAFEQITDVSKLIYLPAGTYRLSGGESWNVVLYLAGKYIDGTNIPQVYDSGSGANITLTMPAYVYIQLQVSNGTATDRSVYPMLVKGSTATAYAPYNGQTFTVSFGQTVYGGVYDANRGKVKPNVYYPSYNGETINGRWLSSKDVYVEGNTPTTGAQVVCLDEYDTEIDVSELSVASIVGTNNITSDCNGDVTASYKVSIQKYIDDQ